VLKKAMIDTLGTDRLYYQDPYLRQFTSRVIARHMMDGRLAVALDRTAFYPTGGGQPNDIGTLGTWPVVDVTVADGVVWHVLAGDPGATLSPGIEVVGEIEWPRRFDHMQQHTGQHILSQAFIETQDAQTVAFHLGTSTCSIDLDRTDLGADALVVAEAAANAVIDRALPVTATFVSNEDLARIPLRKPPKVTESIRIVEVAGFDWSACGGTHVVNTSQVGLIKIHSSERRGAETRITFLCGGRARADYARLQVLSEGLVARFSIGQEQMLDAVDLLIEDAKSLRKELAGLEEEWAEAKAGELWTNAEIRGTWHVVTTVLAGSVERAKRVAQALRARPGTVVFLGVGGPRPQLFFARADDVALDSGALLKAAAAAGGGRGGGRPEWAQGGVPSEDGLHKALAMAASKIGG
jgi:alanyl-tRNA synthetase